MIIDITRLPPKLFDGKVYIKMLDIAQFCRRIVQFEHVFELDELQDLKKSSFDFVKFTVTIRTGYVEKHLSCQLESM